MLPSGMQHHKRFLVFASIFFICLNENHWIVFAKINIITAIVKNQKSAVSSRFQCSKQNILGILNREELEPHQVPQRLGEYKSEATSRLSMFWCHPGVRRLTLFLETHLLLSQLSLTCKYFQEWLMDIYFFILLVWECLSLVNIHK